MKKLTAYQQQALVRSNIHIRLGKWWGTKQGYYGKQGGWIYNSKDWVVVQGWDNFYHRYKHHIWAEIGGEEQLASVRERIASQKVSA